jgi:hypothetical protein
MINMWPAQFEESPQVAPRAVVEEQALLLGGLTGGRVVAEVVEGDRLDRSTLAGVAFIYRLELVGPYLNDYRFSVMTFYHDINVSGEYSAGRGNRRGVGNEAERRGQPNGRRERRAAIGVAPAKDTADQTPA